MSTAAPIELNVDHACLQLGEKEIISNVSFTARDGEFIGIIGPNGAGKSTLLRAIAGLMDPASGRIELNGTSLRIMERQQRARQIGFLPQSRPAYWSMTARAIVGLGRNAIDPQPNPQSVERAMKSAGIAHLGDQPIDQLSGGEAARVHFARLLAGDTNIVIADEPTAALDPEHRLGLLAMLAQLADQGKLVIAALHDIDLAARYCSRLIILNHGEIVADDPASSALTEEVCRDVFKIRLQMIKQDEKTFYNLSSL